MDQDDVMKCIEDTEQELGDGNNNGAIAIATLGILKALYVHNELLAQIEERLSELLTLPEKVTKS